MAKAKIKIGLLLVLIVSKVHPNLEDEIKHDLLVRSFDQTDCLEHDCKLTRDFNIDQDNSSSQKTDFITIPLGCNCQPSFNTRIYGIRPYAFPFDWCFTPYESLRHFLTVEFKDFLKKENLVPCTKSLFKDFVLQFFIEQGGPNIFVDHPHWVLEKEGGMVFIHDFTAHYPQTISAEYEFHLAKYLRRITRFYEEINSGKHVYFIRFHAITKLQSIELFKLLKQKFPDVRFTLIVIGNNEEFNGDWNIPHLKNFFGTTAETFDWKSLCGSIINETLDVF